VRGFLLTLLAGLLLAVAGCGGTETAATTAEGAASIAPESAALYASINTDLDSGQVNELERLLAKFPDRERLLDEIKADLADEDVSWETDIKPALGKTLDLVALDFDSDDVAFILKPANKEKLAALLRKADRSAVTREIAGWAVVAPDELVLDRFEQARSEGTLEDGPGFQAAMDGLPEDALAKLYVNGDAATEAAEKAGGSTGTGTRVKAFAAALGAESSGLRLDGALQTELADDLAGIEPYEPKLLEAAPDDAFVFLSGNGYGQVEKSIRDIPGIVDQLRSALGLDAGELAGLLEGEFALWVGPGLPIPEVTFLAEAKDEQRSLQVLDRLVNRLAMSGDAERRTTEVDGVQAKQVVLDGVAITYAAFDGRVIVTTRPGAIADVRSGGGDSLADDSTFKEASEDAKLGETSFGFLYLDLARITPLVEGFAVGGVPPEVTRNLEPLGAFLLQAGGEAEDLKLSAFLSIE
jgi:Protein of unknown function (DUF3352)